MARAGRPVHEFAIGLLGGSAGQHILEIGPAHGALTQRLALTTPGLRVTAVDPSPDMVALAARRNRALVE
jgi:precorrin-6B methylase 2